MNIAEKQAIKTYPAERGHMHDRPYQREGFIKGYEQAEKKLALTWQDMKVIDQICHDVAFDDIGRQDPIFYNEVLKRFNEQRNERLCKSCRRYA